MLNKKFRTAQKVIDREVSLVVSATNDLTSSLGSVPVKVGEITGFLDGVVQKLQSLKRKVNIYIFFNLQYVHHDSNLQTCALVLLLFLMYMYFLLENYKEKKKQNKHVLMYKSFEENIKYCLKKIRIIHQVATVWNARGEQLEAVEKHVFECWCCY